MQRCGILDCHKLKLQDFETKELAFEAADGFVKAQRAEYEFIKELTEKEKQDKIYPNLPMNDQFWYVDDQGTL